MVKTRGMGRKIQSGRSAGDATKETIAEHETRQTPLEESNQEQQQTNTVELPTTKPAKSDDNTSEAGTSRKRRTRSSTLMELSNAAREMARAIATGDVEEDIVDITDGWETPIPWRKPKREREPTPAMVEFGREMRPGVDYVAAMQKVRILPSASLDKKTLKKLGIEESVNHCLHGMEMEEFVRKIGKTYEAPTREFLSTIVLKYPSTMTFDATSGMLKFSFEGNPYAIKVTEICNLFGFPHDKETSYERTTRHHAKWADFTGEKFTGGRCKAARIQHPAIRYVQRLLSCSLFGRTEAQTITLEELYLMLRPFFEGIPAMNLGALLAHNLTSVKYYTHTKKGARLTSAHGGIVTTIMQACGINLSTYKAIRVEGRIDLDYLNKIHYITGWVERGRQFCYNCQDKMGMRGIILLPNKDLLKLIDGVVRFNPREAFASLESDQISTIKDYNKAINEEGESGGSEDEREVQREDATRFEQLENMTEELKQIMLRMDKAFGKFTSCQQQTPSTSKNYAKRKKATPKRITEAREQPVENIPTYSSSSSTN